MKKNILTLNYMRGVVAFIVMLSHANLMVDKYFMHGIFIQGWCGVDFFFVLSGFLLVYNYKEEHSGMWYAADYLKKKFLRIYPVYWSYMGIAVLSAIAIRAVLGSDIILWNSLSINDIFKSAICYPIGDTMPVIPTAWTLPYTVFFYIVGLVLIFGGIKAYKCTLVLWSIAIIAFRILLSGNALTAFVFNPVFLEFIMGAVSAFLIGQGIRMSSKRATHMFILGGDCPKTRLREIFFNRG